MDREFSLQALGYIQPWDNIDGIFNAYVMEIYKDYFATDSRFVLQDLSATEKTLTRAKIPYLEIIEDTAVLGQLAKSTKIDSLVRTKIVKEGARYRFTLDWLHAPEMAVMASETVYLEPPRAKPIEKEDLKNLLFPALDGLITRVPILGHVTGRDNKRVTVEFGRRSKARKGDILQVSTLEETKRHPLSKEIVHWSFLPVGKLMVLGVDGGTVFCEILEEERGRAITQLHKVNQLIPAPEDARPAEPRPPTEPAPETSATDELLYKVPRIGWAAAGVWLGGYSRSFGDPAGVAGAAGRVSGAVTGARIDGQLWINRNIFTDAGFALGTGPVTIFRFAGALGYKYFLTRNFLGPHAFVRAGFHGNIYTLDNNPEAKTAPASFYAPFLGAGADFPFKETIGAMLALNVGLFTQVSGEQTYVASSTGTALDANFQIGGYYRVFPRVSARVTLDVMIHNFGFENNATVSQRVISVVPALLYYF